jgi:regulator of nucleoside diphosphate kinase
MENITIYVTDYDLKRLRVLLETAKSWPERDTELIDRLESRLDSAKVISQKGAPTYLVTMNCHVRVTDLNENKDMDFWLVYPDEVSFSNDKISVISNIGIAVLGSKVGDTVECVDNNKKKLLRIARIYYQPEENKHYRL